MRGAVWRKRAQGRLSVHSARLRTENTVPMCFRGCRGAACPQRTWKKRLEGFGGAPFFFQPMASDSAAQAALATPADPISAEGRPLAWMVRELSAWRRFPDFQTKFVKIYFIAVRTRV